MRYTRRKRAKAGDGSGVSRPQPSESMGEGSRAGRAQRAASKKPVYEPNNSSDDFDDEESDPDAVVESDHDEHNEESPPVSEKAAIPEVNPRDRPLSEWSK